MTSTINTAEVRVTARSVRAIGTTATILVQDAAGAQEAEDILSAELNAIDVACSRFRADSELELLHANAGHAVPVSPLLFAAIEVACEVAARTKGAVDPTVGNAIIALGYDGDLDDVVARPPVPPSALGSVVGYQHVHLNRSQRTVRIPRGVRLDLGSTAKALVADRAAARIADRLGSGVLVSIGGDVAVAGPAPAAGWAVGIAHDSSTPAHEAEHVVAIRHGGLASSCPSVRTWLAGDRPVHHIIDPRTGDSAVSCWSLVSAVGASCVDANALTTAAVIWGEDALEWLRPFGQAMRLVRTDGRVFTLHGWPEEGQP